MKITNLVKENIEKYGAQVFYDSINNCWDEWSDEIQKTILEDIYKEIKPDKIETIQDLAKLLNGNYNDDELKNPYNINVEELCKKNKWVVLFPYSDDNLEVRGYIYDELGAYDGSWYKIYKEGDFYPDYEEDNTYHKAEKNMIMEVSCEADCDIKTNWCNDKVYEFGQKYIWDFIVENENLPHAYFDIIDEYTEENEVWAKCCVIDLSNI